VVYTQGRLISNPIFFLLNRYQQSQGEHILFIKHSDLGGVTILLVYVDVIIVIGNDEKEKQRLGQCFAKEIESKTLGMLNY